MPLHFVCNAQYFCSGCQRGHKKPRTTAGHEFVSVDKALKGKMKTSVLHCEKHPHQEINTYCHTDNLAICAECSVDFHKGHEVDRLVNVVQGFKPRGQGFFLLFLLLLSQFDHPLMKGLKQFRSRSMTVTCLRPLTSLRPRGAVFASKPK